MESTMKSQDRLLISAVAGCVLWAAQAFGQFAPPVQPNPYNFGPGRIDASTTYRYVGQTVTACGRAAQHNVSDQFFTLGVSPYDTVVAFPPSVNPQIVMNYSFKMVCVTGAVTVSGLYMGLNRATIAVNDPSQIQVIGGTGPYEPPPQVGECRPWEVFRNGRCMQYRAHPYGG
jgi:hypothetical protein